MIPNSHTPKFIATGIGLSAPQMMSALDKKKIRNLPACIVYDPECLDQNAFDYHGQVRPLEWLESEIAGIDLMFLTADFSDDNTFDTFPDIMRQAKENGSFVFVFPINGPVRGKLGYHAMTNEKVFLVEPARHQSSSPEDVIVNGIKVISDLTFVPHMIGVDYDDIKHILKTCWGYAFLAQGQGDSCLHAVKEAITAFRESGMDLERVKGIIVGVAIGQPVSLREVSSGLELIQLAAYEDAEIIFGLVDDPSLEGNVRVSVFAFGLGSHRITES